MVVVTVPLLSLLDFTSPRHQWYAHRMPRKHCFVGRNHSTCPLSRTVNCNSRGQESYSEDEGTEEKFKLAIRIGNYRPNEISLKVEGDKLKVTGKHHQQTDHGYESSEFERSYPIPADVDAKSFNSKLNDDGILVITAAKTKPSASQGLQEDETNFKLTFHVSDYKPDEISVRLKGNELVVDGEQKSESKDVEDSFFHHRKFSRRILLPKRVKLESLQSKLTKDGKLVIEAEKMAAMEPTVRQLEVEYEADSKSKEDVKKETNEADNVTMEE
ncbi:uncharacterized protein LOC135684580 [Rhopilema esculentum]|uniref:uncharacterized protein LOC135684580 n=1 Tax=Rhopilema esculentum TaxID=499914 RepID=UPI0031DACEDE|eukprot:gene16942-8432_t